MQFGTNSINYVFVYKIDIVNVLVFVETSVCLTRLNLSDCSIDA